MAFVIFPGGFGTMDELFEALTLIQTKKIEPFPVFMVGKSYWAGLLDWIEGRMLGNGRILPEDLNIFHLADSDEEVVEKIVKMRQEMGLTD
jgi:hypothetical protein